MEDKLVSSIHRKKEGKNGFLLIFYCIAYIIIDFI